MDEPKQPAPTLEERKAAFMKQREDLIAAFNHQIGYIEGQLAMLEEWSNTLTDAPPALGPQD